MPTDPESGNMAELVDRNGQNQRKAEVRPPQPSGCTNCENRQNNTLRIEADDCQAMGIAQTILQGVKRDRTQPKSDKD